MDEQKQGQSDTGRPLGTDRPMGTTTPIDEDARKLANEKGIDVTQVKGTGKDGTVTKADVEAHQRS